VAASTSKSRDFFEPSVIGRLGALPLFARGPMLGTVSGRHKSPHRGSSVEFAEYRKYVPGDDTRRLDWRAYARSDRFYIKEFEAETNLRAYIVIDSSGSMGFSAGDRMSKLDYAKRIASSLAYLTLQGGDAIGLSRCAESGTVNLPARRNPSHLEVILDLLENTKSEGPASLPDTLHELAEKVRQRALIIIISDFFYPPNELRDALLHLRFNKHDIAAFHLLDPQEIAFEFDRPQRFVDLEGSEVVIADPNTIADRYKSALSGFLEATRRNCMDSKSDYHRVLTDQPYDEVLADFLTARLPKKR